MGKNDKSPAPPGAYLEMNLDLIDEGRFKEHFEQKLRKALRDLLEYEKETADTQGSAVLTLKIKLTRTKGSAQFFDIAYTASAQVPNVERGTTAILAGDRLICQPSGTNEGDPEQQLFFDKAGRIIGGVDPDTGEVHDREVVDAIGRTAKQA